MFRGDRCHHWNDRTASTAVSAAVPALRPTSSAFSRDAGDSRATLTGSGPFLSRNAGTSDRSFSVSTVLNPAFPFSIFLSSEATYSATTTWLYRAQFSDASANLRLHPEEVDEVVNEPLGFAVRQSNHLFSCLLQWSQRDRLFAALAAR